MSDQDQTMKELKRAVQAFCEERDWDQFHAPKELAVAIATESAELLDIFRFKTDDQQQELLSSKRSEISHELADVLYFLLRFAQLHGFDLSEALDEKMKINAEKYPAEASRGSNLKYTER